ncbi:hypothetical protein LguiA_014083 [Lonicera macranthoides]
MAKFKLRISRVIPSFQSCRSKDPSTLPNNPVPSFFRLSPVNPKLIPVDFPITSPPSKQPHRSSFKHHVSSAFISVGSRFKSKSAAPRYADSDEPAELNQFQWQKEDEWHIIAKVYEEESPRRKIYNSSVSAGSGNDTLPVPVKKKRRNRKKKNVTRNRLSTSSADSVLFSDERDGEETETLVSSSRSFSTDSSTDFNPQLETIREAPVNRRQKKKKTKRSARRAAKGMCRPSDSSAECEIPARLSVFKKLIPCELEGKVKESFAIVKKSEDPYEDFRRSMMEMVLEKEMFEERDLEELLKCFLSLNSRDHHGVIVEAFSEIWEGIFAARRASVKGEGESIEMLWKLGKHEEVFLPLDGSF